jgi:cobalt-zinc-cadmium resistance protein CzcA
MKILMYLFFVCCVTTVQGQYNTPDTTGAVTVEEAIAIGLRDNQSVQGARYAVEANRSMKRTSSDIGKLSVQGMFGQYNSYAKEDNNFTLTHTIPFPTLLAARASHGEAVIKSSQFTQTSVENELVMKIKSAWYHLAYLHAYRVWLLKQDSLLKSFARAASVRQRTGETTLLEKVTVESHAQQNSLEVKQNEADIGILQKQLQTLLYHSTPVDTKQSELQPRQMPTPDSASLVSNPQLQWYRQQTVVAEQEKAVQRSAMAPDLTVGYFNQTLIGTQRAENSTELATGNHRFQGFQVGISIPLWFRPHTAKIKAAEYSRLSAQSRYDQEQKNFESELASRAQEAMKLRESLQYYHETALPQADLILTQGDKAYTHGEIGYIEYLQAVRTASSLRIGYLQTLNDYNQAVITLEFILGQR